MLKICKNMTREQIALALDTALLSGFVSESAVFPVASADTGTEIPADYTQLAQHFGFINSTADSCCTGLAAVPESLFSLDMRSKKGLENIFGNGMFLQDTDGDFLPDKTDFKFILPESPDIQTVIAACNLAFRFGMETTKCSGHILADKNYCGNALIFTEKGETEITFGKTDDITRAYINGKGEELINFSALLCEKFPLCGTFDRWSDILAAMTNDFAMESADGQLAYLAAYDKNGTLYHTPDLEGWQKEHFPSAAFYNHRDGRAAYRKDYDIIWEADTFNSIMEHSVYPLINSGDTVTVKAALSENCSIRAALSAEIAKKIAAKGAVCHNIQIVNAYKQGFSWLSEFVVPQLKSVTDVADRVEIYFRPFLPKDQSVWQDENGATPNRTRGLENNPDKWFDLPIRYLQELYPIDDIISRELDIPKENIVFRTYDQDEDITYLCKAYSGEKEIFTDTYKARCSERPYMDQYPQLGLVHPSTDYIKILINGKALFECTFKTDLENVWDIYLSQVLPDCLEYVKNKNNGSLTADMQPFFSRLCLDITLSEAEYPIGCREDILSPLSALHEDLYFTGGDYFKYYGQSHGAVLDAPGLILPQLHTGHGKPQFTVTLYEQLKNSPAVVTDTAVLPADRQDIDAYISRIYAKNSQLCVDITTRGVEDKVVQSYAELWQNRALKKSRSVVNYGKINFISQNGNAFSAVCSPDTPPAKTKNITDIDLCDKEVIGYDEYIDIIRQLKQVQGIEIFPVAESYMGRKTYAVWLKKEHNGYLSLTKYLTNRVSEFINARHHANEVSSTNAAFMLIRELLTNTKYDSLCDKLNLVIVPVENTDGTAIHYELQKEHPLWQLHTARFNALGKEFAYEYYNASPLSSEALATGRIYSRFVPDIMVDNHGVPSHEWDQQFSGYTSPAYKGFWLPRSLLYGYFWYVKNEPYAQNLAVNKKMESVIADAIGADAEMTALNREWTSVFEKYAHSWMPLLFPAEYYGDMINYWIGYDLNPKNMYGAIRYPWLTCVAYTSEVADETAQGDYLALCAKAHFVHDIATIDMLMESESSFEKEISLSADSLSAVHKRIRPLNIK